MALGCAIGVFVTFLPIVGFQMVVVVLLASFLRANKVVGLPIVWISNPATLVPIFYGCYVVGRRILGHAAIGSHWWMELRSPPEGWWESTWFYYSRIMDIAWPLWTGCLVVGAAAAIPAYAVAYGLVSYLRARAFAKKSADISVLGQPDGESAVCKGDGGE
jgi:hypothetical protein